MSQDNLLGKDLFIGEQDNAIKVKRVGFSEGADSPKENKFSPRTLRKNCIRVEAVALGVLNSKKEDSNYQSYLGWREYSNPRNGATIRIDKESPDYPNHDEVYLKLQGKHTGELEEIILHVPKTTDAEGRVIFKEGTPVQLDITRRYKSVGPIGQKDTVSDEHAYISASGIETKFNKEGVDKENAPDVESTTLSPKWIATKICRAFSLDEKKELAMFDC